MIIYGDIIMSNRRMQKEEQAGFWRLVMETHEASGMTVAAFCRQEGITTSSFYLWRKQLTRMDADSPQAAKTKPAESFGDGLARQGSDNKPSPFVEVASLTGNVSSGLTISFPGDISIAVKPGCDEDLLRQAVTILSDRPC